MSFLRRLRNFTRLAPTDRRLLLEAATLLALAWLLIRIVPFRRVAPWLGEARRESEPVPPGSLAVARRIAWAVARAARAFPWHLNCFPRAIASKLMLRRRAIDSTLYFGVRREDEFRAHAWVRVGDYIVTGRQREMPFTVVSRFA